MTESLLHVNNLSTHFFTEEGVVKAVQNVDFEVRKGQTLAIVGESGCGKSVTALSILGLVPNPPGKVVGGEILFKDQNLLQFDSKQMRQIRGNSIAMIFQEPMTSLNPVFTVGNQIIEAIKLHQKKNTHDARAEAIDIMRQVGISDPERRVDEYPHQMSGGMRQRIMIAMALCCWPDLLIADEPTTALDVTIQAQILELMKSLQKKYSMSIMLITHDLGVVAENADEVIVMYASRIVEKAPVEQLFADPKHPYTQGLLRSLPKMGKKQKRLEVITGAVPDPLNFPSGCKFHPRCPVGCSQQQCQTNEPRLRQVDDNHQVACWFAEGYRDIDGQ